MKITATELKNNLGKYLDMIQIINEDILITKNGHVIAKLTNPRIEMLKSLVGIAKGAPNDITIEQIREERIINKNA